MIEPHDIRDAEYIIDKSGIVETLSTGMRRSNRGRKTNTKALRLFLIGAVLTTSEHGVFVVEKIHEVLTCELPIDEQIRLGIRIPYGHDTTKHVLTLNDLYYVTKSFNKLDYGSGSAKDVDDGERHRRHEVMQQACDDLMDVFDLGWQSNTYAIDATGIWSWGRGSQSDIPKDAIDEDAEAA